MGRPSDKGKRDLKETFERYNNYMLERKQNGER